MGNQKGTGPQEWVEESGARTPYTTETGCSVHGPSKDMAEEDSGACGDGCPNQASGQGYLTEDYAVRKHWVQKILAVFNIGRQDQVDIRDAFANFHNKRFTKFNTVQENSLQKVWDPNEIMWCNPPWSIWPDVSNKILRTSSVCIAILPAWSKWWVQQLVTRALRLIFFEVGTRLFEYYGRPVGGIRWAAYALLLVPPRPMDTGVRTKAARRRDRRKKLQH